ncbi:MAG: hypothetical protein JWN23_1046 [Rhodocyclales bacterium]|nr:hypothetical protein [Rhodocyclales bacterium]
MYQIACPSCGAQVAFRSAASVMAVCAYCQSTLLRDADSVRDIGKMSAVLEDYSPIQINTAGMFEGKRFTVVGRIQLEYEDGYWNEWYALFDDGTACWLSDASGKYALTTQSSAVPQEVPIFERIQPGGRFAFEGAGYVASDVRTARCTGGQGELPFKVGEDWQAKVADYRSGPRFLTLDYSDGPAPVAYVGKAVTLETMACQLLREETQIEQSAGKLRGSTANLECPNCGASIAYRPGIAQHLVCQTCHAEVAARAGQAEVLAKNEELEQRTTTLALGDIAKIGGAAWTLIGLMECRETGSTEEASTWVEYLLYHPQKGFQWIVESMEGWDLVTVLDEWPEAAGNGQLRLRGQVFSKLYDYGAEVIWAAGAFNWRVHIGDRVSISDFKQGNMTLTAERSASELNWSLAKRVAARDVLGWFGKAAEAGGLPRQTATVSTGGTRGQLRTVAWIFTALIVVLNIPVLFSSGFDNIEIPFFGLIALWFPIGKFGGSSAGDDD